jgi:NodT family efflux transporter outer membrane factor (OMF) lipoprotein
MLLFRTLTACLLGCATSALLTGCNVPHDNAKLTPFSAESVGLKAQAVAAIAPEWWTALGDPQLDAIIADALNGSPSLEMAMARLRSAEAGLAVARAGRGPDVFVNGEETRQRLSGKYIIPPPYAGTGRWVGSLQTNLIWNLDLAGRQKALVDQARASHESARLSAAAARIALSGAVAQAYINFARADAQAKIADEFTTSRTEAVSLAQSRKRAQLASDTDVIAAEILLAEARQAKVRAEGARTLMIHALAALVGHGADFYARVTTPTITLATVLPVPNAIPADLLGRRADILAARARIESAEAGKRAARAAFYPDVNIRAFVGTSAIGLGSLFTDDAFTAGVGPAVHLPLFTGGRLYGNYRGAVATIDAEIAAYDDLVVRAVREAADALSSIDSKAADALEQHRVVAGLQATMHLDEVRVRAGLAARLDVLNAGERLLDGRQRQIDIEADGAIHRVQLLVALGGGFVPETSQFASAQ